MRPFTFVRASAAVRLRYSLPPLHHNFYFLFFLDLAFFTCLGVLLLRRSRFASFTAFLLACTVQHHT